MFEQYFEFLRIFIKFKKDDTDICIYLTPIKIRSLYISLPLIPRI